MAAAALSHGGRSSNAGIKATVFGPSGFLGKYVVSLLGNKGVRMVLPYRGDEVYMRNLKVCGDLGYISMQRTNIRKLEEIEHAVEGSNVVINLLGRQSETRRWSFEDIHVNFPAVLAEVCAEKGTDRLIHVSSIVADVNHPSKWARSKALGEQAVLEAFPSATIMRCATLFGDEDHFLRRIARISRHLPFLPLPDGGTAKTQPVLAQDVAAAIMKALIDPATKGKTYELAGEQVFTYKEVTDFVFKSIGDENNAISVPTPLYSALAAVVEQLPGPWLTRDEVTLTTTDVVRAEGVPCGLKELGIKPTSMLEYAPVYLQMYNKNSEYIDEGVYVPPPK